MTRKSYWYSFFFLWGILACRPLEPSQEAPQAKSNDAVEKPEDSNETPPTQKPDNTSVCPKVALKKGGSGKGNGKGNDDGDGDKGRGDNDGGDNDDNNGDDGDGNTADRGDTATPNDKCTPPDNSTPANGPSFATDVSPILIKSCVGSSCHSSATQTAGFDMETKKGAQNGYKGALKAMQKGKMPIGGFPNPTSAEIKVFEQWGKTGFAD